MIPHYDHEVFDCLQSLPHQPSFHQSHPRQSHPQQYHPNQAYPQQSHPKTSNFHQIHANNSQTQVYHRAITKNPLLNVESLNAVKGKNNA